MSSDTSPDPPREDPPAPLPTREQWLASLDPRHRERMARMSAWPRRLTMAYADRRPDVAAAIVARLEYWVDPADYPNKRYEFAAKELLRLTGTWQEIGRKHGVEVKVDSFDDELFDLLDEVTPQPYRDQAIAMAAGLAKEVAEQPQMPVVDTARVETVCVMAAQAALVLTDRRLFPSYRHARLTMVRQIRDLDGMALGAPEVETITDVPDERAITVIEDLLGMTDTTMRIPRSRSQQGLHDLDLIAVAKQFLLEHPDPTPAQLADLRGQLEAIVTSVAAEVEHRAKPKTSGVQRPQPKRQSRAKRKGKGKKGRGSS